MKSPFIGFLLLHERVSLYSHGTRIDCFICYCLNILNFVMQLQPITTGDIDPAVLASLPPSMQLDLLVQVMRPN